MFFFLLFYSPQVFQWLLDSPASYLSRTQPQKKDTQMLVSVLVHKKALINLSDKVQCSTNFSFRMSVAYFLWIHFDESIICSIQHKDENVYSDSVSKMRCDWNFFLNGHHHPQNSSPVYEYISSSAPSTARMLAASYFWWALSSTT